MTLILTKQTQNKCTQCQLIKIKITNDKVEMMKVINGLNMIIHD